MVEAKSLYKIIGICGSLRKESTNLSVLKLIPSLNSNIQVEIVNYLDVPLYNGDVEEATGIPESVKAIASKIAEADGVYIACPEYNYSVPGVLKNLLDWISRIRPSVFDKKPVAIFSVAAGNPGGARAQYDLRKILVFFNALVMNSAEVQIGANYLNKFNDQGELIDEAGKKALVAQASAFVDWIRFVKAGTE